jgi:protoporphyrinogen oxidase
MGGSMKVAVIGGGMMGISLGYFLAKAGATVEIFEASPSLGGLAGQHLLEDGVPVDRYYHAILSSDNQLLHLCRDLEIDNKLRFRETQTGFYHQGRIHSMNNLVDFLQFPPLGWIDRLRLGLTILTAQFVRDWRRLEGVNVEDWLLRLSGRRVFKNIWHPMLKAKFDGGYRSIPATYIWARLVRMSSTRKGANQKESVGHLVGGHMSLIQAMANQIENSGGRIYLNQPVSEIMIEKGKAWGLRYGGEAQTYDIAVVTLQVPLYRQLIPDADPSYHEFLSKTAYLGIISTLLVLDRPLSGFWTLNITDDRFPFTGVIETTSYIDPKYVGGHHLVYLPKYTAPDSEWQQMSDDEIREKWLQEIQTMFPHFDQKWIRYIYIHRERYVEPLHQLNGLDLIPAIKTPIENLYLATTAQIYPRLTNAESVSSHAYQGAQTILQDKNALHIKPARHVSTYRIDEQVAI